jgi:hypothetical protein
MNSYHRFWLRSVTVIILFFLCSFASYADNLIPTRTPSTGYQPQFQVSRNNIFNVWHENHGQTEPIWVTEESVK